MPLLIFTLILFEFFIPMRADGNRVVEAVENSWIFKHCGELFAKMLNTGGDIPSPEIGWLRLRARNQLVSLNSFPCPKGEGYCGPATAINAVQAAAMFTGNAPIVNPSQAMKKLSNQVGSKGMKTPEMANSIHSLLKEHFPNMKAKVDYKILNGMDGSTGLSGFSFQELAPERKKVKVLTFYNLDKNQKIIAGHTAIIKDYDGKILTLVDSNSPETDILLKLKENILLNKIYVPNFFYSGSDVPDEIKSLVPFGITTIDLN